MRVDQLVDEHPQLHTPMPEEQPGEVLPFVVESTERLRSELAHIADRLDALASLRSLAEAHQREHGTPLAPTQIVPYGLNEIEAAHRRALVARAFPKEETHD